MAVQFNSLPASLEEFRTLSEGRLTDPEYVCGLFLCALNLFVSDMNAGYAALDILRGPRPMTGYDRQFIRDRLMDKKYLPLAYFDGAEPGNNYTPNVPYNLSFSPDPRPGDVEENHARLFLATKGADSPRPMNLRCKPSTGEWFLWEYSSILVGIRIPVCDDPWA